mmetsp:Transcript_1625/g.5751  ORF Transcript_1625/g.5751 Transcript_1625/m.5751 type:complete len:358 (+) Transcript_1625:1171-2244(+)
MVHHQQQLLVHAPALGLDRLQKRRRRRALGEAREPRGPLGEPRQFAHAIPVHVEHCAVDLFRVEEVPRVGLAHARREDGLFEQERRRRRRRRRRRLFGQHDGVAALPRRGERYGRPLELAPAVLHRADEVRHVVLVDAGARRRVAERDGAAVRQVVRTARGRHEARVVARRAVRVPERRDSQRRLEVARVDDLGADARRPEQVAEFAVDLKRRQRVADARAFDALEAHELRVAIAHRVSAAALEDERVARAAGCEDADPTPVLGVVGRGRAEDLRRPGVVAVARRGGAGAVRPRPRQRGRRLRALRREALHRAAALVVRGAVRAAASQRRPAHVPHRKMPLRNVVRRVRQRRCPEQA